MTAADGELPDAYVDFAGEIHELTPNSSVTLGRVGTPDTPGQIVIDDNPYLHRQFLRVERDESLVWLANVGSAITASIADGDGLVQSWLSPGGRIPLVFARTAVWFTAGPTMYELDVVQSGAPFASVPDEPPSAGETTIGRVTFTPDQKLLVLALAEEVLRGGGRGGGSIPASATAAQRLGWTTTKFNRKLDNVCDKLTRLGARGLHGGAGNNASNRRVRLVEYALSSRLVTKDDLGDLESAQAYAREHGTSDTD